MSDPLAAPSSTPRLVVLDALRGLACMAVVFSHLLIAMPQADFHYLVKSFWLLPLLLVANGHYAVLVFLLLSGFVLAKPHYEGKSSGYGRFMLKRFCRLYPAYAVTIGLAAWLLPLIHAQEPLPGATEGFNYYLEQIARADIPGHFLMLGRSQDVALDGSVWTLIHELRISAIFPLLLLLCRDTRVGLAAAAACFFGGSLLVTINGGTRPWAPIDTLGLSLLWTLRLVPYFIAGILLCKHENAVRGFFRRRRGWQRALFLIVALLSAILPQNYVNLWIDLWLVAMAAILIMMPLDMPRLRRRLEGPVPRWLGDISYSVYIVHLPVIVVLAHRLWGTAPYAVLAAVMVATVLASATLMRRAVELPFIRLGRIGSNSR